MSELSPEAREQLARTAGAHTPVWDHNEYGFRLDCGCRRFTHFGTTREEAETRFGDHMTDALAPTVASIVTAAVEAERARIVSAVEAVGEFDAWLTVAPGVRVRVMHAHDVRTTLASTVPALDAVKAEVCSRTVGQRPYWMGVDQYDPCRCKLPAGHEPPCACEHADPDRIARGSRTTDETEQADEAFERNALAQELAGETEA